MRVETNAVFVRQRRQFAQLFFLASFIVPVLGILIINTQSPEDFESSPFFSLVLPFILLPIAYGVMMFGIRLSNRWIRRPRPEDVLEEAVRGAAHKSVFYNYYFSPANHVLVTPFGVFSITVRYQDGVYRYEGGRWTSPRSLLGRLVGLIRMDMIGNPVADAVREAQHVEQMIQQVAPSVTVQPLVVFTDPRARVQVVDQPEVPVLSPDHPDRGLPSLREYLRELQKQERRPTLSSDEIDAFEERFAA
jgi:hypothetical protein